MDFIQQLRWRPGFGDPTPMGWLTTAAYALAAFTAYAAARRAGRAPGLASGSRSIWILVTALMTFLGLNKQLDLQSLLTDVGRVISWKLDFYQQRRDYQKWFMVGMLAASSLGALSTLVIWRCFWKQHVLLASGLVPLLAFIALRAGEFHHISGFSGRHPSGAGAGALLETGGIVLIWLAAMRDWRNPRKAPKPPWKPAAGPQS
jgi:hypothetical protein